MYRAPSLEKYYCSTASRIMAHSKNISLSRDFLLSVLLHACLGFGVWGIVGSNGIVSEKSLRFRVPEGGVSSFKIRSHGYNQSLQTDSSDSRNGGNQKQELVSKFLANLKYPPLALEQKLESKCSWEIVMGENYKISTVKRIQICKYMVFQNFVEDSLKTWKFELNPGEKLLIPVSFELEKQISW